MGVAPSGRFDPAALARGGTDGVGVVVRPAAAAWPLVKNSHASRGSIPPAWSARTAFAKAAAFWLAGSG